MTKEDQAEISSSTAADPRLSEGPRRSQRQASSKALKQEQTEVEPCGEDILPKKKAPRPRKAVETEESKDATNPMTTATATTDNEDNRPKKKRARRPKKEVETQGPSNTTEHTAITDDEEIKQEKKRARRPRKAVGTEKSKDATETTSTTDYSMLLVVLEPMPALLRLPPEVWYQILSYLPTSHVAPLSFVCTRLLEICRSWPRWRAICKVSVLGEPKRKYRTHMALVCSESYYICDLCDTRSTGTGSCGLSGIPLYVSREDDQNHRWRLCRKCRIQYFLDHPDDAAEEILSKIKNRAEISEYDIIRDLKLKHDDLFQFDRRSVGYHSYRRRFYNPQDYMFNERQVTEHATDMHGGWVGVLAARFRLSSDVLEEYKLRKRLDQLPRRKKAVVSTA